MTITSQMGKRTGMEQLLKHLYSKGYLVARYQEVDGERALVSVPCEEIESIIPALVEALE